MRAPVIRLLAFAPVIALAAAGATSVVADPCIIPDDGTPIVAIEAGRGETLRRFVGRRGLVIWMEGFGASAPYADLATHFGFSAGSVANRVKAHV